MYGSSIDLSHKSTQLISQLVGHKRGHKVAECCMTIELFEVGDTMAPELLRVLRVFKQCFFQGVYKKRTGVETN